MKGSIVSSNDQNFTIVVPTYNRVRTLQENIGCVANLGADEFLFIDNCSTDSTFEFLKQYQEENDQLPIRLIRNKLNIGYPRSFIKSVHEAKCDRIVFFSDEDAPETKIISTHKAILDISPNVGVALRAKPYSSNAHPSAVPQLEESEVIHRDDEITVIKPGLYAAHMAYFHSAYVGGMLLNRNALTRWNSISLEAATYPQRMLAMDAAYNQGVGLAKGDDLGLFPRAHADTKGETLTPRQGDWGVVEWADAARILYSWCEADDVSRDLVQLSQDCVYRYAYTRFGYYFEILAENDVDQAFSLMCSIYRSNRLFRNPLFWYYNIEWINQRYSEKRKAIFKECCQRLYSQIEGEERNGWLHNFTGFGNVY
jgi:glycosyltransferase involved in cell wall biosynthesis